METTVVDRDAMPVDQSSVWSQLADEVLAEDEETVGYWLDVITYYAILTY